MTTAADTFYIFPDGFRLRRDEDALIISLRALEREVCRQEERAMQVEEAAIGETHAQAPFDHEGAPR